jgi:hypothetical protein
MTKNATCAVVLAGGNAQASVGDLDTVTRAGLATMNNTIEQLIERPMQDASGRVRLVWVWSAICRRLTLPLRETLGSPR